MCFRGVYAGEFERSTSGALDADAHHAHSEPPVVYPDIETLQSETGLSAWDVGVGVCIWD